MSHDSEFVVPMPLPQVRCLTLEELWIIMHSHAQAARRLVLLTPIGVATSREMSEALCRLG